MLEEKVLSAIKPNYSLPSRKNKMYNEILGFKMLDSKVDMDELANLLMDVFPTIDKISGPTFYGDPEDRFDKEVNSSSPLSEEKLNNFFNNYFHNQIEYRGTLPF
ncbi:MAG: hypothetical protein ACQEWI_12765 [Bacillota bacterium]